MLTERNLDDAIDYQTEKKLQEQIDKEIVEINDTLDFISPYQR